MRFSFIQSPYVGVATEREHYFAGYIRSGRSNTIKFIRAHTAQYSVASPGSRNVSSYGDFGKSFIPGVDNPFACARPSSFRMISWCRGSASYAIPCFVHRIARVSTRNSFLSLSADHIYSDLIWKIDLSNSRATLHADVAQRPHNHLREQEPLNLSEGGKICKVKIAQL